MFHYGSDFGDEGAICGQGSSPAAVNPAVTDIDIWWLKFFSS